MPMVILSLDVQRKSISNLRVQAFRDVFDLHVTNIEYSGHT